MKEAPLIACPFCTAGVEDLVFRTHVGVDFKLTTQKRFYRISVGEAHFLPSRYTRQK